MALIFIIEKLCIYRWVQKAHLMHATHLKGRGGKGKRYWNCSRKCLPTIIHRFTIGISSTSWIFGHTPQLSTIRYQQYIVTISDFSSYCWFLLCICEVEWKRIDSISGHFEAITPALTIKPRIHFNKNIHSSCIQSLYSVVDRKHFVWLYLYCII